MCVSSLSPCRNPIYRLRTSRTMDPLPNHPRRLAVPCVNKKILVRSRNVHVHYEYTRRKHRRASGYYSPTEEERGLRRVPFTDVSLTLRGSGPRNSRQVTRTVSSVTGTSLPTRPGRQRRKDPVLLTRTGGRETSCRCGPTPPLSVPETPVEEGPDLFDRKEENGVHPGRISRGVWEVSTKKSGFPYWGEIGES